MKRLSSNQIRQTFLDYFKAKGHTIVPSSGLIPINDSTLLFTNAGMVQFKDTFLGVEKRPYVRAVSSQRCVRAGGKHNDLENVGYTRRHHTFFEMLGNFSFGDYFKRDAIQFAWQFLTVTLGLPQEKLWVTVFHEDKESETIWLQEIKVDPARLSRCGEKDNFWQMGDVGPCGPCTEIFYDHGPEFEGGPPGSPDEDGERYVEVWNLVFMQYDRNAQGDLTSLPKPCVDTGMGLERIAAVLQGVHDNYEIDLFQHLLAALAQIIGVDDPGDTSMRVIVDHIRSCAFLIVDGVIPSNEGRGYVLRRILRRAIRHGYKLGQKNKPFFYKMVHPLVEVMGEAYPELSKSQPLIEKVIKQEEAQFSKTLARGLKILDQAVENLHDKMLPGQVIFQLYDTYGFPPDLTADIARERGLTVDEKGFQTAMKRQRVQSQQSHQFAFDTAGKTYIEGNSKFIGYDALQASSRVIGLLGDHLKPVSTLKAGAAGVLVLDLTPFYAESGGQVGDRGVIKSKSAEFKVTETKKQSDAYLHFGKVIKGDFSYDDQVAASVDKANRQAIRLNHSATHLLHAALRYILGPHVQQKGSLVAADRLRFDFSHTTAMTAREIQEVEQRVNAEIRKNHPVSTAVSTPEQAKKAGATAFFGERYGDQVRVLTMGDFSKEICGGTHVERTGDIGLFKITSEGACASGVRRIEAVTGQHALDQVLLFEKRLTSAAELLKTDISGITSKLENFLHQYRELERELSRVRQLSANRQLSHLEKQAVLVGNINVLSLKLEGLDRDTLRSTLDQLKQHLGSAAIILGVVRDDKIQLVAHVSQLCLPHFTAVELLNFVAQQVGGKGGGRPNMAQGGGTEVAALPNALASVVDWVKQKLS